jgi:hypothetical protein
MNLNTSGMSTEVEAIASVYGMCYNNTMKYINYFAFKNAVKSSQKDDQFVSTITFSLLAKINWQDKEVFISDDTLWISDRLSKELCDNVFLLKKFAQVPIIGDDVKMINGATVEGRINCLSSTLGYYVPHIIKMGLIKQGGNKKDIKSRLEMKNLYTIALKQGVAIGFGADQGAACFPRAVFDEALGLVIINKEPEVNIDSIKSWGKNMLLSAFYLRLNKHRHNSESYKNKIVKEKKKQENRQVPVGERKAQMSSCLQRLFKQKNALCVDIEMFEDDHAKVLEFGLTNLSDKTGLSTVHYIVSENLHLANGRYVPDNRENFAFGKSRVLPKNEIARQLMLVLKTATSLVAHGVSGDVSVLTRFFREQSMGKECAGLFSSLECIDSSRFTKLLCEKGKSQFSVKRSLEAMKIPFKSLHNAGNDAAYTVQILHALHDVNCLSKVSNPPCVSKSKP